MKKNIFLLTCLVILNVYTNNKLYEIDKILAIIYTNETAGSLVITESDLKKLDINGQERNLNDLIMERLMYLEALKYKIQVDEEAIDKYILSIQKQHNLSLDQLKGVFKASGYTYQEGRQELKMMYAVNQLLDAKIKSRLVVTQEAIEKYYNENPIISEKYYLIEKAFIPFTEKTNKEKLKKSINNFIKTGAGLSINWKGPFDIKDKDLSDKLKFIKNMKEGNVHIKSETDAGFELIKIKKIIEAQKVPLSERKKEISFILRKTKFEELLKNYKEELLKKASIKIF